MSGRVRSKLVRLLEDLDLKSSVSFDAGAEEASFADDQGSEDGTDSSEVEGMAAKLSAAHASVSYGQYAQLEKRAMELMSENKVLQTQLQQHAMQTELEAAELRGHLRTVLDEMEKRQREVENKAPIVKTLLEDYRGRVQDLRISEAQYQQLLAMPADGLHMLDQVKIAAHEATRELSREAEQLRLALATSRDSSARLAEEVTQLRAEGARAGAALAEREREARSLAEALQSRINRLSSELEQALIRAELNSAKGQMYDELRLKAERVEAENSRLLVVEATFKRLQQQVDEADKAHRQKEHSLEMLQMDKAYLSKQVEFMAEQQRKTQGELEMREAQVGELQRVRSALYEKLMEAESGRARIDEARLHKELSQLQASTHADLERIRVETAETYEREARLLRELRDQAVEDAARVRIAHSELQDLHDKTVAVNGEVQRRLEGQVVELQAELRQKAFELGHLRVVMGEKEGLLGQAGMQVELLQEKMQVLRDRCSTLEASLAAAGAQAPSVADAPVAARDPASGAVATGAGLHTEALAALRREKAELTSRVAALEAKLKESQSLLSLVGQPHAYMVEQLVAAKERFEAAERHVAVGRAQLAELQRQADELAAERDALRRDLDVLLAQRAGLDEMKRVVMRAVGAAAMVPLAAAPGGAAALLIQGAGAPGTTTIIGG